MAFSSYRTNFKGKLANIDISKLRVLDRSKTSLQERKAYINKKYEEVGPFIEAYIFTKEDIDNCNISKNTTIEDVTQYYKYNLNSEDNLSSDINVFKYIESDATYLLNSEDVILERSNRFSNRKDNVSLEDFYNLSTMEANKDNYRLAPKDTIKARDLLANPLYKKDYEEYLEFWEENNTLNTYLDRELRVTKKKFVKKRLKDGAKNNKLTKEQFYRYKALDKKKASILRQQETTRVNLVKLKLKLMNSKYDDPDKEKLRKNSLRVTINAIRELKKDMIYTKKSYLPRICIEPDKCGAIVDLCNNIDYSNREHIKNALLLIPSESISTDFNIVAYDIQTAIKRLIEKSKLSTYEVALINNYRKTVSNMSLCARIMQKHKTQIYRDLYKIVDKIIKELNKF